ncbi:hypothetical protein ACIBEK_05960 [Nocardia fusca]|uniref:hypothetical protein n=1 Tax=Nocardia fusca TaxID=941183 RepID=UPI0037B6F932
MIKPGARYRSQVCATEVIVVRPADIDLMCGGHAMLGLGDEPTSGLDLAPDLAGGSLLGKRYTNGEGTLELLVTKAGEGTLADGETPLTLKETRALPASD